MKVDEVQVALENRITLTKLLTGVGFVLDFVPLKELEHVALIVELGVREGDSSED